MAYEVTATKKRPQTFDELSGQEFVASTLKNSLLSGRIAHAYLFSGPRGVGKTSAARILAKALNCEKGPAATPCGICTSCVEITRGNSLDVIEIDGASNTSVNDVREIKDEVLFSPNSSRYKVYIIDEVHMLSNSAFNALLKTIEEPPPYIVFVFATTELHKVPATIKSRCQQFNFRLISPDDIRKLLTGICEDLGITAENDALFWIAKESMGSMRDAYTLFDQIIAFSGQEITLAKIREKLGFAGLDSINELSEYLSEGKAAASLEYLDSVISSGVSVEQFIVDLTEYFRNLLFIKNGITRESILGFGAERFSKKALERFSVSQLEKAVEMLLELYRNIRYSLNQRFELELLLCRMSSLTSFLSHSEILSRLNEFRTMLLSGPSREQEKGIHDIRKSEKPKSPDEKRFEPDSGEKKTTAQQRSNMISDTEEEEDENEEVTDAVFPNDAIPSDLLQRLAGIIRKKKLALSSALEKAVSWSFEKETLYLVFDSSFSENFVRQDLGEVAEKARELLSRPVRVVTEIRESSGSRESKADDQVEIIKRVFRGQIVQGE